MKNIYIEVDSVKEAWIVANKYFPTDYMKDEQSSSRAGYPIFRSTCESLPNSWYNYICDLCSSLEVNLCAENWEGTTIRIAIRKKSAPVEENIVDTTENKDMIKKENDRMKKETLTFKSEVELRALAYDISCNITIRDYINGCSRDTKRRTNEKEREQLFNIIYGALWAINYRDQARIIDGAAMQSILDTAEVTGDLFFPDMNGYDSIYSPIKKVVCNWEEENKFKWYFVRGRIYGLPEIKILASDGEAALNIARFKYNHNYNEFQPV